MDEMREVARGDALVDQLCYLGAMLRDRVRDALHTGVKRAMAVVCSGFSYDMEVVSHGFVTDISKTDAENEERLHVLIDEAEVPGERFARLFESEVLPPETSSGVGRRWSGQKCGLRPASLFWVSRPVVKYLSFVLSKHYGLNGLKTCVYWFIFMLEFHLFPFLPNFAFSFDLLLRRLRLP